MIKQITPLLITYNEECNIERTLEKLTWAQNIVVIDSGSTDRTLSLLARHSQVRVVDHEFQDFSSQCNFGLTQVQSDWVLSLDADYELSDALIEELRQLRPSEHISGYRAAFVYRVYGRSLGGTLYPARVILYRRERASYRQHGHAHRVVVDGEVLPLRGMVFHDDRKPLSRWLAVQRRYAGEEATYLLAMPRDGLSRPDRLRLMAWPAPFAAFLYALIVKRCLLDGWPGWYYALQRLIAEALLALEIIDRRLSRQSLGADPGCQ